MLDFINSILSFIISNKKYPKASLGVGLITIKTKNYMFDFNFDIGVGKTMLNLYDINLQ